jgi:hypothetical protein
MLFGQKLLVEIFAMKVPFLNRPLMVMTLLPVLPFSYTDKLMFL